MEQAMRLSRKWCTGRDSNSRPPLQERHSTSVLLSGRCKITPVSLLSYPRTKYIFCFRLLGDVLEESVLQIAFVPLHQV